VLNVKNDIKFVQKYTKMLKVSGAFIVLPVEMLFSNLKRLERFLFLYDNEQDLCTVDAYFVVELFPRQPHHPPPPSPTPSRGLRTGTRKTNFIIQNIGRKFFYTCLGLIFVIFYF
jgi:hypothetical protein